LSQKGGLLTHKLQYRIRNSNSRNFHLSKYNELDLLHSLNAKTWPKKVEKAPPRATYGAHRYRPASRTIIMVTWPNATRLIGFPRNIIELRTYPGLGTRQLLTRTIGSRS